MNCVVPEFVTGSVRNWSLSVTSTRMLRSTVTVLVLVFVLVLARRSCTTVHRLRLVARREQGHRLTISNLKKKVVLPCPRGLKLHASDNKVHFFSFVFSIRLAENPRNQ